MIKISIVPILVNSFNNCFYIFYIQHLFDIEVLHIQENTDSYTSLQGHYSYHGYTVNFGIHQRLIKKIKKQIYRMGTSFF